MQNFCASVVEAQLQMDSLFNPDGSPTGFKQTLETLNMVFTFVFTFELLVDFFSHSLREFIMNRWSLFDLVVVLMSLIVLGPLNFPVSMLRALRVVRLFGRLESSKKILSALSVSLIPMCNAFFIMLVVAMMCECRASPSAARPTQRANAREQSSAAPVHTGLSERNHQPRLSTPSDPLTLRSPAAPASPRPARTQTRSWGSPSSAIPRQPASTPLTGP